MVVIMEFGGGLNDSIRLQIHKYLAFNFHQSYAAKRKDLFILKMP